MKDIRGSKAVEILISPDGKTLWVNAEGQEDEVCVLRIQEIGQLNLIDYRKEVESNVSET